MSTYRLALEQGHLVLHLDQARFVLDTGSPASFGTPAEVSLDGQAFPLPDEAAGLSVPALRDLAGIDVDGLLGTDVLNGFDVLFDVPNATLDVSVGEVDEPGETIALEPVLGVPRIEASVEGTPCAMFFDTGAQFSYCSASLVAGLPSAGRVQDFYPGIGRFEAESRVAQVTVGPVSVRLKVGVLPGLVGAALMLAGCEGILGNEIFRDRRVLYAPRRNQIGLEGQPLAIGEEG